MEKFAIGVLLGMVGGAVLVANNYKMRVMVKKGQEEVAAKFNSMMDEKIEMMSEAKEKIEDKIEEKLETPKKKKSSK